MNIRTRAKQNPPVASVNAALERDLITLQCEPVASTEFAFNIGPYQVPTALKLLLCLPSIVIYPRLWLTLTMENGGVLVQCTPTFYRQQQELQKQAAKEFAAINNWRYTAKKSGAWYPRITTERMIFTTTSAHY